jgi:hypothetical protein
MGSYLQWEDESLIGSLVSSKLEGGTAKASSWHHERNLTSTRGLIEPFRLIVEEGQNVLVRPLGHLWSSRPEMSR